MQVTFSIKFTLTSTYACSCQTIMLKIRAAAGSQCHLKFFFESCEYNNEDGDYDNMDNYYHGRYYYLTFSCVCWVVTNHHSGSV